MKNDAEQTIAGTICLKLASDVGFNWPAKFVGMNLVWRQPATAFPIMSPHRM